MDKPLKKIWLLAAFLAWIVPGAGHLYINRRTRGIIIFFTVTITFWVGVAAGGVMTVDRHCHPLWFYAQMGAGINGVVSWHRQKVVYNELLDSHDIQQSDLLMQDSQPSDSLINRDKKLAEKKIALVPPGEDVARAYTGIIGMMNMLAAFDAALLCLMGISGEPAGGSMKEKDATDQDSTNQKNRDT